MATPAHCAYCFESLAADLEDRKPLSFQSVQDLWIQYDLLGEEEVLEVDETEADGIPQLGKVTEPDEGLIREEQNDDEQYLSTQPTAPSSGPLQLPSISRLQALSPASASSSSSTPSSSSATSSSLALGGNSKSSSNSSFFSLGRSKQPSPAAPAQLAVEEQHPLFVTWNTTSSRSRHKSLRGCIGTFDAQELQSGLKNYALTACVSLFILKSAILLFFDATLPNERSFLSHRAFHDTRFPPVAISELPTLSCSVTLLTNFTPCASALDWDLGTHGIRITFMHHSRRYGATYLPDVATEQGWTKEETMVSLMRKAGWSGRSREWRDVFDKGKGSVVRYEGEKASLGWEDWAEWRNWVTDLEER